MQKLKDLLHGETCSVCLKTSSSNTYIRVKTIPSFFRDSKFNNFLFTLCDSCCPRERLLKDLKKKSIDYSYIKIDRLLDEKRLECNLIKLANPRSKEFNHVTEYSFRITKVMAYEQLRLF